MSLSHEWWEHHLTPNGWVEGSSRIDFAGVRTKPVPADRLLTCTYHERLAYVFSKGEQWVAENWRSLDTAAVNAALNRFGPSPH